MMTATVNCQALAEKLRVNRANHAEVHNKAMERYRAKLIEAFEEKVELLRNDPEAVKTIDTWVKLPRPEEHLDDYDNAIGMLEWHQGETMDLDQDQFNQLVLDQWGWHKSFITNTTSYVSAR